MEDNESYCDGCKYITWMIVKATGLKCGGGCNHPVVLKNMDHRTSFTGVPKEKPRWCAGKKHGKVMHIDTLTKKCGYFIWNSPVNNGYGCDHPKQEDQEEFKGKEHGRCMRNSCPIAFSLCPHDEPEDRKYFDCDDWENMTDGDWMLVFDVFKSGLDPQGKKPDETKALAESKKDIGVLLSRVGEAPKEKFFGWCPYCSTELIEKPNHIKYCEKCQKEILSPEQSIAQEILDYIEGQCPHTHKECDYWKEIQPNVFSCTHPEDDNTICPLEKDSKDNEIKEMN
ncbi:hypothetical protein KAU43_03730 [candidate division WOR-3 bacterium]|nr:hypothetical protein [candidate division WOR-3 bacterium]